MASAIRRMLASLGLAPAAQVRNAEAERERAAGKLKALDERVAKARADAESWKRKHEELSRSVNERQDSVARADARTERARAEIADLKARNERLTAQVSQLRAELTDASRATAAAREHLMATELKLDLVEAAIRVLDVRTREAAVERQAETR